MKEVLYYGIIYKRLYAEKYYPDGWLFPGDKEDWHITERTVQRVFEATRDKAKIRKDVSFHSLRYSFPTHLLEGGTDVQGFIFIGPIILSVIISCCTGILVEIYKNNNGN